MPLIGMPSAAKRANMSRSSIQRALENAGIELVKINERAFAVEEDDLEGFIAKRGDGQGPGRPKGAKEKIVQDNIPTEELEANGFKIVEPGHAKHIRYNSHRWQCQKCQNWFKQVQNHECAGCRKKKGDW